MNPRIAMIRAVEYVENRKSPLTGSTTPPCAPVSPEMNTPLVLEPG